MAMKIIQVKLSTYNVVYKDLLDVSNCRESLTP